MSTIAITPHEHVQIVTATPELLAVDCTWTVGASTPPAHFHPNQDEHFDVLEGTLRVTVDGEERLVGAGESIDVPRGAVHAMAPVDGPARARWEIRPALGTEAFWREMSAADGNPLKQLSVVSRHPDEFRLAGAVGAVARGLSAVRRGR